MTTITLPNGRTAVSFVPEDSKDLCIVHISTVKQLARLLPKANPRVIIQELIDELEGFKDPSCALEDAVSTCNEFTAFHETVNLIRKYEPDELTIEDKNALIGLGIAQANKDIDQE